LARAREESLAKQRAIEETGRELESVRASGEQARVEAAGLRARLEAEQKAAAEKIQALVDVEKNLKTSFEALAANALDANSQRLIRLAKGELDKQQVESAKELAAKESAIEMLLKPMQESLAKLSTHSQELEVKRQGAYEAVLAEVQNIQRSHADLRRETTQLVAALRAPKVRGNWGEMQLRRAVDYIEENCTRAIRLEELAELTGLSQSHFSHAFKASTGVPPHQWQTQARLERAKQLLLNSEMPLTTVAVETGFADQAHFTRVFRKNVGSAPASWKRSRLA